MTLLQHCFVKDDFVMVARDTRVVVEKGFGPDFSSDKLNKEIVRSFEIEDKACFLTDKVIFSMGGYMDHGSDILTLLHSRVKPDYDLDECEQELSNICQSYANMFKGTIFEERWKKTVEDFSVYLTGFDKNGWGRIVHYNAIDGFLSTPKNDVIGFEFFAPTPDAYDALRKLYESDQIIPFGSPLDTLKSHMLKVHGVISHIQPREVSSECLYLILQKDENGNIVQHQPRVDAGELISKFNHNGQ